MWHLVHVLTGGAGAPHPHLSHFRHLTSPHLSQARVPHTLVPQNAHSPEIAIGSALVVDASDRMLKPFPAQYRSSANTAHTTAPLLTASSHMFLRCPLAQ